MGTLIADIVQGDGLDPIIEGAVNSHVVDGLQIIENSPLDGQVIVQSGNYKIDGIQRRKIKEMFLIN